MANYDEKSNRNYLIKHFTKVLASDLHMLDAVKPLAKFVVDDIKDSGLSLEVLRKLIEHREKTREA